MGEEEKNAHLRLNESERKRFELIEKNQGRQRALNWLRVKRGTTSGINRFASDPRTQAVTGALTATAHGEVAKSLMGLPFVATLAGLFDRSGNLSKPGDETFHGKYTIPESEAKEYKKQRAQILKEKKGNWVRSLYDLNKSMSELYGPLSRDPRNIYNYSDEDIENAAAEVNWHTELPVEFGGSYEKDGSYVPTMYDKLDDYLPGGSEEDFRVVPQNAEVNNTKPVITAQSAGPSKSNATNGGSKPVTNTVPVVPKTPIPMSLETKNKFKDMLNNKMHLWAVTNKPKVSAYKDGYLPTGWFNGAPGDNLSKSLKDYVGVTPTKSVGYNLMDQGSDYSNPYWSEHLFGKPDERLPYSASNVKQSKENGDGKPKTGWGDFSGMYSLSGLSPVLYNFVQSMKTPEREHVVLNPYAATATSAMARRRYNVNPTLAANNRASAVARGNNARLNPNTGMNQAYNAQLAANQYAANAQAYAARDAANAQYAMEYANLANNLGTQYVQSKTLANDLNARNRAAVRNFGSTAAGQFGNWSQTKEQMYNQAKRDKQMAPYLQDYLEAVTNIAKTNRITG